jgi:hypothetical protein
MIPLVVNAHMHLSDVNNMVLCVIYITS